MMIDRYQVKLQICRLLSGVSPEATAKFLYRRSFKKPLDLGDPRTLNEKVSYLKLNQYARSPLVSLCADKYEVRRYLACAGCAELLNELYGVWEDADAIPAEALPERFVLKCTHGCGYNLLCADKARFDFDAARRQLDQWLHTEYWKLLAELQYKDIKPRIVCEKYLGDAAHAPLDYKVYCFNGKPRYILVCEERETSKPLFYFFDTDWRFCPITRDGKKAPADFSLPRPRNLDFMLACAEKLSAPFPFVRVDLYETDGRPVFGELTFTPSGGLDTGRLPESDRMFGELLRLDGSEIDPGDLIYRQCMEHSEIRNS